MAFGEGPGSAELYSAREKRPASVGLLSVPALDRGPPVGSVGPRLGIKVEWSVVSYFHLQHGPPIAFI